MTDAPAWAKGHQLEHLKAVASLFAAEMKPHSYGAFGLPKERDVADAMSDGAAIWTRYPGKGELTAAAIFRRVRRPAPHEDFAGRRVEMRPGDLFIRHMAGTLEGKLHLLRVLADRAQAPAIWWEAHVEAPEVRELVSGRHGWRFEHVMTKVAASSDLKALFIALDRGDPPHIPPLPAADVPGVKVLRHDFLSPEDRGEVLAELEAYGDRWAQHYSSYNKGRSWTSFALHGFEPADPGFIIKPAEMSKQWKAENPKRLGQRCGPTLAAKHFPRTLAMLERLPGAAAGFQRIRFMRLSANGGELTRHADITDPQAGTKDGCVARLHIPIRTSPACVFRSWSLDGEEHRLHMPERGLSYIDTRKPHAVINPAEVERVHLVVDAFASEPLRALIAA